MQEPIIKGWPSHRKSEKMGCEALMCIKGWVGNDQWCGHESLVSYTTSKATATGTRIDLQQYMGIDKTRLFAKTSVYWINMKTDIEIW